MVMQYWVTVSIDDIYKSSSREAPKKSLLCYDLRIRPWYDDNDKAHHLMLYVLREVPSSPYYIASFPYYLRAGAKRVISYELLKTQLSYRIKKQAGCWDIARLLTLHVSYVDVTRGHEAIGGLQLRTITIECLHPRQTAPSPWRLDCAYMVPVEWRSCKSCLTRRHFISRDAAGVYCTVSYRNFDALYPLSPPPRPHHCDTIQQITIWRVTNSIKLFNFIFHALHNLECS